MNTQHEFMHTHQDNQEPHSHSHSHVSGHGDAGSLIMRGIGLLAHGSRLEDVLSDYRSKRLVPADPHVIIGAMGVLAIGVMLWRVLPVAYSSIGLLVIGVAAAYLALIVIGGMAAMLFVRQQREAARKKVIDAVRWRGDERVLDVACGTGLMLNACAKQLTTGKATGIDMWEQPIGGTPSVLMQNAHAEGVADKISYQQMDARHLSFEDASFDVTVSSFALHHIGTQPSEPAQAVSEMIRVLASGGTITLIDIAPMIDIAERVMREAGLQAIRREGLSMFQVVTGQKA